MLIKADLDRLYCLVLLEFASVMHVIISSPEKQTNCFYYSTSDSQLNHSHRNKSLPNNSDSMYSNSKTLSEYEIVFTIEQSRMTNT